jgi:hypothetical protein
VLAAETRVLSIERRYNHITSVNRAEVSSRTQAFIDGELQRFGGSVSLRVSPDRAAGLRVAGRIMELVEKATAQGADDRVIISDADLAAARRFADVFGRELGDSLAKASLAFSVGSGKLLRGTSDAEKLIAVESAFATDVLFGSDADFEFNWTDAAGELRAARLPRYSSAAADRELAASLLAKSRTGAPEEAVVRSADALERLESVVQEQFGQSIFALALDGLPPEAIRWVLDNRRIAATLGAGAAGAQ